ALRHRVALELVGQLTQHRAAEGQVAQVTLERCEACDVPTVDAERRHVVRDDLFSIGGELENRATQLFERAALGLLEHAQVCVDVFGGHGSSSLSRQPKLVRVLLYPGRSVARSGRAAS